MVPSPQYSDGSSGVCYNKGNLYIRIISVDRAEPEYQIYNSKCKELITSGYLSMGVRGADNLWGTNMAIFYANVDLTSITLTPNEHYTIAVKTRDSEGIDKMTCYDFIYNPILSEQYSDVKTGIYDKLDTVEAKIEETFLGNKKLVMAYCSVVPDPNPRKLFIGCEDYVTEYIKKSADTDWSIPVSQKTIWYWYDDDQKAIISGEED